MDGLLMCSERKYPASPFLITGLPRSRLAWLAVTMSACVGGCWCVHEPLAEWEAWTDVVGFWRGSKERYIGVADSALGFHAADLAVMVPGLKIVVVDRPTKEVRQSSERLGFDPERYIAAWERSSRKGGALMVPYSGLDDPHTLERIVHWCCPGAVADHDKLRRLTRMHIESDLEKTKADAVRRSRDMDALLGANVVAMLKPVVAQPR